MGGFIVIPKAADQSAEEVEARYGKSLDVFRRKNLELDVRLVRRDFVAYRYRKLLADSESAVEFDNGDFAFCTGTFIYDGATGRNAVARYYEDASRAAVDEARIAGNFHLLLWLRGELWSLSDYCGYYPVYLDEGSGAISSSFLAAAMLGDRREVVGQAFYEYLLHGFFVHEETLLRGVRLLDGRQRWRLLPGPPAGETRQPAFRALPPGVALPELVDAIAGEHRDYYAVLARLFHADIGAALSGGYDSRHMLALLRQAGETPYLYVYGAPDSPDVVVARHIARDESLALDHTDKGGAPKIDAGRLQETVERDFYFFDGIKPLGLIDDGSDLDTRFARARRAALQLNGAGGEIYREIWNIGDRSCSMIEFLKMRFDCGDYRFCRGKFDVNGYFSRFAEKVRSILDTKGDTLSRSQAEMLFPFLRNKFAQANNLANSQISHSLLPFMESRFVFPSFAIPIRYKYCGEIHAALIRAAYPSLGRYRSAYGINFSGEIPLRYRLRKALERQLPLRVRLMKRSRGVARAQPMPYFLARPYVDAIVDLKRMNVADYVDVSRISSPEVFSRALSVELLLSRL